jgi:hypothetical protein
VNEDYSVRSRIVLVKYKCVWLLSHQVKWINVQFCFILLDSTVIRDCYLVYFYFKFVLKCVKLETFLYSIFVFFFNKRLLIQTFLLLRTNQIKKNTRNNEVQSEFIQV